MKIEIIIEASTGVKQDLLARLADLFPGQHIADTAVGLNDDRFQLKMFVRDETPDPLLQEIARVVATTENLCSGSHFIDVHVRNMECSESTLDSKQQGKPFSPVAGLQIIPWRGSSISGASMHDIILDPAHAFGTGLHPSTRLCLQLMKLVKNLVPEKKFALSSILDIGCGSGILTIAALRLGAARALAVDIDPAAVDTARRNIQINRLAHSAQVAESSWQNVSGRYDLVLANLVPSVLFKAVPAIAELLSSGGFLITAGFPALRNVKILEMFRKCGLHLVETYSLDGWGGLLLSENSTLKKIKR
jgi:ribosomal protein L11 methyltransferase